MDPRLPKCWIPNPGLPRSKLLGGSKGNSDFHPSKINQMSTRNIWDLVVRGKLLPRSGLVALRQLNLFNKKGP